MGIHFENKQSVEICHKTKGLKLGRLYSCVFLLKETDRDQVLRMAKKLEQIQLETLYVSRDEGVVSLRIPENLLTDTARINAMKEQLKQSFPASDYGEAERAAINAVIEAINSLHPKYLQSLSSSSESSTAPLIVISACALSLLIEIC